MSLLEVKNLKKSFGDNEVLKDISLEVNKGEVLCIIGPSGSGKSTLLKLITGVATPTSGSVEVKGKIYYVSEGVEILSDKAADVTVNDMAYAYIIYK